MNGLRPELVQTIEQQANRQTLELGLQSTGQSVKALQLAVSLVADRVVNIEELNHQGQFNATGAVFLHYIRRSGNADG